MRLGNVPPENVDNRLAVLVIARENVDFVPLGLFVVVNEKFFRAEVTGFVVLYAIPVKKQQLNALFKILLVNRVNKGLINIVIVVRSFHSGNGIIKSRASDKRVPARVDIDGHIVAVQHLRNARQQLVARRRSPQLAFLFLLLLVSLGDVAPENVYNAFPFSSVSIKTLISCHSYSSSFG